MAEYDNRLRFTLFRNKKKTSPNHADFNGTFTDEDGREYYMDAWSKEPKSGGEKFLSGVVKLKAAAGEVASAPKKKEVVGDEIPF